MLNFKKKLRTSNGLDVRILATDAQGEYSVIGLVTTDLGDTVWRWSLEGVNSSSPKLNLVEVPESTEWYVNVYDGPHLGSVEPRADFSIHAIGTLKLTITEGKLTDARLL